MTHITFKLETNEDGQALVLRIDGMFEASWSCHPKHDDIEKRKLDLMPHVFRHIFNAGKDSRSAEILKLLNGRTIES